MRAVLFDMDGVLVRSEEVWFRVVEAAGVRFRNRPVTREEFFPTFGQGTAADIPVFGLSCTVPELDAFYVSQFVKHLGSMWVNPEAAPVVEGLRARGLQVALVTNTVAPLTKEILEHARLAHLFEVRATSDRVANAKPAPDLVQLALKELNVAPADAVMVGDSKYDRQAAGAAHVRFIGLKLEGDSRVERLGDLPVEFGWSSSWRLRQAKNDDRPAVDALLTALKLPTDASQFPAAYVVAVQGSQVVGVAALERHGDDGLLRSVAVESVAGKSDIQNALVEERLAEARKLGLVSVSLLTSTARASYLQQGFVDSPRGSVSAAMSRSDDFSNERNADAEHLIWRP